MGSRRLWRELCSHGHANRVGKGILRWDTGCGRALSVIRRRAGGSAPVLGKVHWVCMLFLSMLSTRRPRQGADYVTHPGKEQSGNRTGGEGLHRSLLCVCSRGDVCSDADVKVPLKQAWKSMPAIPVPWEDHEFKASWGHKVKLCLEAEK